MEMIRWADHVRNEEVLLRFKEQRNLISRADIMTAGERLVQPPWAA
jgi:hypothetical protein